MSRTEAVEFLHHRQGVYEHYASQKRNAAKFAVNDVGSPWVEGTDPNALYPQECYVRAFRYATDVSRDHEGVYLVHGECGLAFGGHAWVELPNDLVFDGVFQLFFPRTTWYEEIVATPWYKYSPGAAFLTHVRVNGLRPGEFHYRWDCQLGLPWASDPNNPLVIDDGNVKRLLGAVGLL